MAPRAKDCLAAFVFDYDTPAAHSSWSAEQARAHNAGPSWTRPCYHPEFAAERLDELPSTVAKMLLLHLMHDAFIPMNHEKGRHDLVKAFYFDVLGLTADPRKAENLELGRKGVWANAGITQFHLPEADAAQVLDGSITLVYSDLAAAKQRCAFAPEVLARESSSRREALRCTRWDCLIPRTPTQETRRMTTAAVPSQYFR